MNTTFKGMLKLAFAATMLSFVGSTTWAAPAKKKPAIPAPTASAPSPDLKVMNVSQSSEQAREMEQSLRSLASQMTATLSQIENLLHQNQPSAAFALAKSTLDSVRVKVGIDPKARLQENFYAATTFPSGATEMSDLPSQDQEIVIRTVRDFRGGLYLDIMNLAKRTSLLYIRAFHAQVQKDGGLTQEDRNKIVKDLAVASVVPLYVVDKRGVKIVAFDEDVANEDHTYMFNREIKMYLLNATDLKMTEKFFEDYKSKYKRSLGGSRSVSESQAFRNASQSCIEKISRIVTGYIDGAGIEANQRFVRICSEFNNFNEDFSCIDRYMKNATGYIYNVGSEVLIPAIKTCHQ